MMDGNDVELTLYDETYNRAYFDNQRANDNAEFWRRMEGSTDFSQKSVLDLGCGLGSMSIELAERGAASVVGIDIDRKRITFAKMILAEKFPHYSDRVSFQARPLETVDRTFDIVISKDSFEHIEDLGAMLDAIARILAPGGRLVTGFGPLYYSPFGDHGRYAGRLPWLPVILPEPLLFWIARRHNGHDVRRTMDLGLNKLTARQFRMLLARHHWTIEKMTYNAGSKPGMALMNLLRKIPLLERYFTVSIYAVIQKPQ